MPKLAESEDGSDPDTIKISTIHYLWPSIAKPINRSACGIGFGPMKGTVRPLFSILVLVVFAATLSFRTVPGAMQTQGNVLVQHQSAPLMRVVFNDTLLKYAAIEIGQAQVKQKVEELLEGNFGSQGRYRSFAFNTHENTRARRSSIVIRSPQVYRYWLDFRRVLQDWVRKKRFEAEIMSELVRQMKHPIDRHYGLSVGLEKRYSSCAVVGNSGILLKSDSGKLIDSHEFVIRLNNARTGSFEPNVGSKTNVSFVNSNILHFCGRRKGCFCHPYGSHVPMIMYICQPVHLFDYTVCNTTHKAPLLVTDPRFDMLCSRIVKYYSLKLFAEETGKSLEQWSIAHDGANFHYSSGMQAVMLALGICDQVSLFGFGKSDSAKHHYHTNQKEELGLHDYEAEYAFYRDVAENPEEIPFISGKFKLPPLVIYR